MSDDALSIRLATIERNARQGTDLDPDSTLELVNVLRIYMSFAEETNRKVTAMAEKIGGAL